MWCGCAGCAVGVRETGMAAVEEDVPPCGVCERDLVLFSRPSCAWPVWENFAEDGEVGGGEKAGNALKLFPSLVPAVRS